MSEKKEPKPSILDKPWRVVHSNGDVVAGFDDEQCAEDDAVERNKRADEFGIAARYTAAPKP